MSESAVNVNIEDDLRYLRGAEAFKLVSLSAEVTLSITTALGKKIRCKSRLTGCDFGNHIFLASPDISPRDKRYFLNAGYWVQVDTICDRGEGARLSFKSRITRYVDELDLLAIELPYTVTMKTLRSESRYATSIKGVVANSDKKVPMLITDLSKQGCGLALNRLHDVLSVEQQVKIRVKNDLTNQVFVLSGEVKNRTLGSGDIRVGVKFNDKSADGVRQLMSQLTYNGDALVFAAS
ncbi:PilZ domain-containing protein [Thaumasiovibrio subtropicus]|uniref:PilZ domain-containing protein n=1 Tax=Thaumasiovibrio subtropicus TaxID=1891207 RepID=UPI00131EBD4F|nr:PilZ domain-containing protein [Thaumasiovibrio subtropicus]